MNTNKPCRCTECGSPHVQYAVWHSPNTGEVHDVFGSWNAGDNTYCETCDVEGRDPNPNLVDYEADKREYHKAERKWKAHEKAAKAEGAHG